jgi:hypothetical protein
MWRKKRKKTDSELLEKKNQDAIQTGKQILFTYTKSTYDMNVLLNVKVLKV